MPSWYADDKSASLHAIARNKATQVEICDVSKWGDDRLLEMLIQLCRASGPPEESSMMGMGPTFPTYCKAVAKLRAELSRRLKAKRMRGKFKIRRRRRV